jgi:hypothetical protein
MGTPEPERAALPAEHPVHVSVDLVHSVDLAHFVVPPGPKGEKPSHPHALFGALAWGYLHGVRPSRKLARLAGAPAAAPERGTVMSENGASLVK